MSDMFPFYMSMHVCNWYTLFTTFVDDEMDLSFINEDKESEAEDQET